MRTTDTGKMTFAKVKPGEGLKKALRMSPEEIIGLITESGLKGRGGAGFPTDIKWKLAAAVKDNLKYVVCNADEGEPGTFKDRVILTDFADLMFDGMTIGARAIGACKGIIYLRGEYTYLRSFLKGSVIACMA